MITLKTYGGLANRMRVIDSTYQVSRIMKQDLKVIWEMSFELNCSFLKLFKPLDLFELDEYYSFKYIKKFRSLVNKSLGKAGINSPFGYNKYINNTDIEKAKENNSVLELFSNSVSIYVSTVHQYYTGVDSFQYFTPADEIKEIIEKISENFSSNTIGIHIRRADNLISIKSSPREAFIARMQDSINTNNDTRFFLATDSPEEEKYLNSIFPGRIITYKKELSRNSEKGIQDALIDLFCLSNTNRIIGSFYSSFSEVAAQINNIPLELINISS